MIKYLALLAILVPTATLAHDWYPKECCNEQDCRPVPAGLVTLKPDGWHLPGGEVVPLGKEQRHKGDDFHICTFDEDGKQVIRWLWKAGKKDKACLYIPGAQG